jgi:hypothetical protein
MSVGDYCDDPEVEASFAEDEGWIAALARQVFRARGAGDTVAVEVTRFYLEGYLVKVLQRHLRYRDPLWDGRLHNDSAYRWLDNLNVDAEMPSPGRLELRGQIAWAIDQSHHYDPFAFDLRLCPETGAFRGYVFRFGDHRPLSSKNNLNEPPPSPVGEWQYVIHRGSLIE